MNNGNIGYLYFKDYFTGGDIPTKGWKDFSYKFISDNDKQKKADNKELLSFKNDNIGKQHLQTINSLPGLQITKSFKVLYPGLVTGIGITHETGATGELKSGLHFDYAAGCPIIYGSSVKGILRNAFTEYPGTVADIINLLTGTNITKEKIEHLESEIFEGKDINKKPVSVYSRDTFFDAIIIKHNTKGRILDEDSITPHPSPIKNPIPIYFLKIASGVHLQFQFKLYQSHIIPALTIDKKLQLFENLLEISGIGAKTKVGYGQLK